MVKNNQDKDSNDNELINLASITVNKIPFKKDEVSNKNYSDDSIEEGIILRFNQTLQIYLKVSVGNDTYNLTNYDKVQITDTTSIKYPNIGGYLLQQWNIKCNDKNISGNMQNFIKSTKTNSPTSHSGAESLPPVGDSFMYRETSSNNHGNIVFVSFERTDFIQISNLTFYYNRLSFLTNNSLKSTGQFRIQLLSEDNTWSTR